MLFKIEFGDPCLRKVRLARKYELDGVAFVKDFEKTVGFTFYSQITSILSMELDDLFQAKKVYDFFKTLFKDFLDDQPNMGKSLQHLHVEWKLKTENKDELLKKLEQTMGVNWKNAFDTIFSVHEK
jgi:hypothetical protein